MTPEVFLTADGQCRTIKEWSRILGIKTVTLHARRRNGWSDERIIRTPCGVPRRRPPERIVEHDGLCLTAKEWSKRTGVRGGLILDRLQRGWSVRRALTP